MKRITLIGQVISSSTNIQLPTKHQLTSFVYNIMDDEIRNELHKIVTKQIKPFVFSKLIFNEYKYVEGKKDTIVSSNNFCKIIISSVNDALIDSIKKNINCNICYQIGNLFFKVNKVVISDDKFTGDKFLVRTEEPILLTYFDKNGKHENHVTFKNNKDKFFELLVNNINRKCNSSLTKDSISINEESVKEKLITYNKNSVKKCMLCEMTITCNSDIINHLYYNGIGMLNSGGFGMISVKPVNE